MGSLIADMRIFSLIASVIAIVIARVRIKSGEGGQAQFSRGQEGGWGKRGELKLSLQQLFSWPGSNKRIVIFDLCFANDNSTFNSPTCSKSLIVFLSRV